MLIKIVEVIAAIPGSISIPAKVVSRMGNLKVSVGNVATVGLIAFISVWAINRGLTYANKASWRA